MKLGIVGTNFISDWLVEAAKQVVEVEVSAVFSRKQETGDGFSKKHSIPEVYIDWEAFLQSDIDAVYIATPTYAHCRQTLDALNHKKHVLCEKILAVNEKEARLMFACAKENGVVLLEAMKPDFDPGIKQLEEALPKIGKLRRVTVEYCQYSSRYDRFRQGEILNAFNPELSNAAIVDIGVYCIHTIIRLFGKPRVIKAISTKLNNGFEAIGIVSMQYDDMIAEAVYSKVTDSVNRTVFMGEEGCIRLDAVATPKEMEIISRNGDKHVICFESPCNNMVFEVEEFARLIKEKCIDHKYRAYSLNTLCVTDEARRQTETVFSEK